MVTPQQIDNLTPGVHTLTITLLGYQTVNTNVTVIAGQVTQVSYTLIPNPVCNWQCEVPANGYESNGCGDRRINAACNAQCVSTGFSCEMPLNGYERDNCGTRRLNSACNSAPPPLKWKCSGPPFYDCGQASDGVFDTQAACQAACQQPAPILSSLLIEPKLTQIQKGDTLVITVMALNTAGLPVPGQPIIFTSVPDGIVSIFPYNVATFTDGKAQTTITALENGLVEIRATSSTITGTSTISVAPKTIKHYRCDPVNAICYEDPGGPYDSLEACQAACTPTKKDDNAGLIIVGAILAAISKI